LAGLKGLHVNLGWRRAVDKVLIRTKKFTHVRNLNIEPLTQAAYQSTIAMRNLQEFVKPQSKRSALLRICLVYDPASPTVLQAYPKCHKEPTPLNGIVETNLSRYKPCASQR